LYLAKSLEIFNDELAHLEVNSLSSKVEPEAPDSPEMFVSAVDFTEDLFEEQLEEETLQGVD
jgi:hypothetical protein